ncbi:unnamed protein product [Echinostoma caproni]|uniref:HSA domain-containing protein n=1 Tax=Echinostoma caproni TaxID=27848 RepID=A0A183AXJ7_9TREM|nr:unnamed protein product [Echinostoma caproni]
MTTCRQGLDPASTTFWDGSFELVTDFSPPNHFRPHAMGRPWFDYELHWMLKRRKEAWKAFSANGFIFDQYEALRNACSAMKFRKRLVNDKSLASEAAFMPKRFYEYLRHRTHSTADIPSLEINGILAETDVDNNMRSSMLMIYHQSPGCRALRLCCLGKPSR